MNKDKQDFNETWQIIKWLEEDKENNSVLSISNGYTYNFSDFLSLCNIHNTNAINWKKVIPQQKEMMTEDEVMAFIFKHRDKILLKKLSVTFCVSHFGSEDNEIALANSWVNIKDVIEDYKYTLSTDIDNIEWKGWEKV